MSTPSPAPAYPGAFVHLGPVSGETDYSANTDALGHFLFQDVKVGAYRFGYASQGYVASDPLPLGRQVQITEGGKAVTLEGRMTSLPRISGRVLDSNGNAVANARLEVVGRNNPPVSTDAAGNFELRLDPGSWILSVVPPPGLKPPDPEPDSDRVLVWTRTFYPGVALLDAASRIVLRPGSELSGIEIKLLAVPSHAVRGVLLNPDGTPAPKAAITLGEDEGSTRAHTMFARDPARTLRTQTNADGAFEFPQVTDGEWLVAAELENGGEKRRATQWIDMAGRELEGVKLRLAAPFTLRGHVVIDTPEATPRPDLFPVLLVPHGRPVRSNTGMLNWMLFPELHFELAIPRNAPDAAEVLKATQEVMGHELTEELGATIAAPDADGNFSLKDVYSGSHRIVSMPPPPPYYMAAVRIGDANLTTAEIDLSSGAAPITIVYKTDGGAVRGTAEKCAGGLVLLVPQDPAIQSLGFFRSARCDSGDRYEFTAVRPADYFALAVSGNGGVPQLDDILLGQATKITIRSSETTSIDLHPIPR